MYFNRKQYIRKFDVLGVVISLLFLALILYSFKLQVVENIFYQGAVNVNAIKQRKIPAQRGDIYDRTGKLLVSSEVVNDLYIIPHYYKTDISLICDYIQLDCEILQSRMKHFPMNRLLVAKNISKEQAEILKNITGLFVSTYSKRKYVDDNETHVVGYVGRINRDELETNNDDSLYAEDDIVGQTGVEYMYNKFLHGVNGAEQYVVMANGLELLTPNKFITKEQSLILPGKGSDIHLSIDDTIQNVFALALKDKRGTGVMINIHTGEIIAMYSNPGYDPTNIRKSFLSKDNPLMNRAISAYAPGSTFKIVTALAALELGLITSDEKLECPGYHVFGGRVWKCWNHKGHGFMNLRDAIKQSCDVYFYKLSQRVGLDNINKYAKILGLGEFTGIPLDGEAKGRVPTVNWYKHSYKDGWNPGSLLNTAIGQGVVQITPLQLARAYGTLVNGGDLLAPQIVFNSKPKILQHNTFKPETVILLKDAFYSVINEEGGTAYYSMFDSKIKDLKVSGKTGTAQTAGLDKKTKDNAWFVGYYPSTDPEIAVCVFVEAGEHGSSVAPIAFQAIDQYRKLNAPVSH